ncbi:MAG: IS5 family transposase [Rhodococcus sp.]|nr:IS5 family transposase [Rhodococcus sp. (in: high G+C Gram-positive bacteria)]
MRVSAVCLISEIIERLEGRPSDRGRPRLPVEDVVAALQFFLREGVQWRALPAGEGRASGSTLRRRLLDWHDTALLTRVHRVLLRMVRSDPETATREWDVIVDSCSVRAKRGGDLTGPNPTDRGKRGTKYHLVVASDGLPLGAVASAANVHDTRMFPELLRLALVASTRIARLFADAGYDSADNRWLCLRDGIQPRIRKIGTDHGSGLGVRRSKVENANAWILNNKRLDRRHDRLAEIIQSLLTAACIFVIANRYADF